jgi:hypothetical protein
MVSPSMLVCQTGHLAYLAVYHGLALISRSGQELLKVYQCFFGNTKIINLKTGRLELVSLSV